MSGGGAMNNLNELFKEIADQKVWSAYQGDEVPVGEQMTLVEAQAVAAEQGLPGVGIVMTGGIHFKFCGKYDLILLCIDFTEDSKFELPWCIRYVERSPSGGWRAFNWVGAGWAEKYADSPAVKLPNCARAGFYIGTTPKFFAVTGVNIDGTPNCSQMGIDPIGVGIGCQFEVELKRRKGWVRAEHRIDEHTENWLKYDNTRRRELEAKFNYEWKQGEAERRAKWEKEQDELEACRARMEEHP